MIEFVDDSTIPVSSFVSAQPKEEEEEEKGKKSVKRELTGMYVWSGRTRQSYLRRGSSKGEKDAVRCTTYRRKKRKGTTSTSSLLAAKSGKSHESINTRNSS